MGYHWTNVLDHVAYAVLDFNENVWRVVGRKSPIDSAIALAVSNYLELSARPLGKIEERSSLKQNFLMLPAVGESLQIFQKRAFRQTLIH